MHLCEQHGGWTTSRCHNGGQRPGEDGWQPGDDQRGDRACRGANRGHPDTQLSPRTPRRCRQGGAKLGTGSPRTPRKSPRLLVRETPGVVPSLVKEKPAAPTQTQSAASLSPPPVVPPASPIAPISPPRATPALPAISATSATQSAPAPAAPTSLSARRDA